MTGAIFWERRPATIMRSAWRGEGRNTSAPKRATSRAHAAIDIISMAQQARPKPSGQIELLRAQFTALSSCVKMMPSSCSSLPKSSGLVRVMPLARVVSIGTSGSLGILAHRGKADNRVTWEVRLGGHNVARSGNRKNKFAELLSFFEMVMRGNAIVERPDFVHNGCEAALRNETENGAQFTFVAHVRAYEGKLAGKEEAQIDFAVMARGGAASHETAGGGQAFDALVPSGCADMLKNDIDAMIAGEAANFLGDGHDAVVNQFVRAD